MRSHHPAARRRSSQSIDQEACELIFIHLADAHRKVAVADPPGATDMAVDRNIVWRISTDQVDGFITQKRRIGTRFARIAANEFVPPEYRTTTRTIASSQRPSEDRFSVTRLDYAQSP
jgi:hypothetical protein